MYVKSDKNALNVNFPNISNMAVFVRAAPQGACPWKDKAQSMCQEVSPSIDMHFSQILTLQMPPPPPPPPPPSMSFQKTYLSPRWKDEAWIITMICQMINHLICEPPSLKSFLPIHKKCINKAFFLVNNGHTFIYLTPFLTAFFFMKLSYQIRTGCLMKTQIMIMW